MWEGSRQPAPPGSSQPRHTRTSRGSPTAALHRTRGAISRGRARSSSSSSGAGGVACRELAAAAQPHKAPPRLTRPAGRCMEQQTTQVLAPPQAPAGPSPPVCQGPTARWRHMRGGLHSSHSSSPGLPVRSPPAAPWGVQQRRCRQPQAGHRQQPGRRRTHQRQRHPLCGPPWALCVSLPFPPHPMQLICKYVQPCCIEHMQDTLWMSTGRYVPGWVKLKPNNVVMSHNRLQRVAGLLKSSVLRAVAAQLAGPQPDSEFGVEATLRRLQSEKAELQRRWDRARASPAGLGSAHCAGLLRHQACMSTHARDIRGAADGTLGMPALLSSRHVIGHTGPGHAAVSRPQMARTTRQLLLHSRQPQCALCHSCCLHSIL